MGFSIYYRSIESLTPQKSQAIREAADAACEGRSWLSCEPVSFFHDDDGHLMGGSKPNFAPHPDDVADAAQSGLPDGGVRDLVAVLCQVSREHGVDWDLSHDHEPSIG